jgi:hypothetical protein
LDLKRGDAAQESDWRVPCDHNPQDFHSRRLDMSTDIQDKKVDLSAIEVAI